MPFDILIATLLLLGVALLVYLLCRLSISSWKTQYEATNTLLASEQSKNQYLLEQQTELVYEKDDLNVQLSNANQTNDELNLSLEGKQTAINNHLKTIESLHAYENKYKQLEQTYDDLYTNKYKPLRGDYEGLSKQHQQTQKDLNKSNQKVKVLQDQLKERQTVEQKHKELAKKYQTLVEQNQQFANDQQALTEQHQALIEQNQQFANDQQALVTQNQRKLAHLHQELKDWQQKNKELTQIIIDKEAHAAQQQEELVKLEGIVHHNQDLLQQIAGLKNKEQTSKDYNIQELAGLHQNMTALQDTNNRFTTDLQLSRQKNKQQTAALKQLRASNANLLKQVTQLTHTQSAEQSEQQVGKDWQKMVAQLQAKIKHITAYNHELSITLDDCRNSHPIVPDFSSSTEAKAAAAIVHRNQEIERYRQTIKELKDKLTTEGQNRLNLSAALKTLQHQFDQLSNTTIENTNEQEQAATEQTYQLNIEITNLQQKIDTQEAALVDKTTSIHQLQETLKALQESNQKLHHIEEEEAKSLIVAQQEVQTLQQQIQDLETANARLLLSAEQVGDFSEQVGQLQIQLTNQTQQLAQQEVLIEQQQQHLTKAQQAKAQCQETAQQLEQCKAKLAGVQAQLVQQEKEEETLSHDKTEQDQLAEKLTTSEAEVEESTLLVQDDLTKIKGIGRFIAKKLQVLGITSYEQIANFTPEDIKQVTESTDSFPGRIHRDDWIQQAKNLIKQK